MANVTNKSYLVTDETGTELKTLKSLTAAKKLADAEGGRVVCDGEVVYVAEKPQEEEALITEETVEEPTVNKEQGEPEITEETAEEPVVTEETKESEITEEVKEPTPQNGGKYRLISLMNIRSKPSMTAPIIGLAKAGTVVIAQSVENDWLKTADGYILYGKGQFARKI